MSIKLQDKLLFSQIKFEKEEFEKLEKLFLALGFNVQIKWFRTRHTFEWENINVMIDTAKEAIENLSQIASSSQAPRAYEVLAKLIDTTVQANKDLIDLQAKMKEMKDIETPTNPKGKTINNNLFVGSTAELQKVLQELKNGK